MKGFLSVLIVATAGIVSLTSCEYKELEDITGQTNSVAIRFNWINVDSIPQCMRLAFYPENSSAYNRGYTLVDAKNDTVVQLVNGRYSLIAWNNDTEHVLVDNYSSSETAAATTGKYSAHGDKTMPKVLDSIYNNRRILDYPDYMVHANNANINIGNSDGQYINITPDSMVVTVEVILNGIKGLEHCHKIRCTIDNVAGKRYIAYPNKTDDNVIVMFDGIANKKDNCVTAKFFLFGTEPTQQEKLQHKLLCFFWITGNQIFIPIDVTKVVHNYRNKKYMKIVTPELNIDLKDYIRQGNTMMDVDAEDWGQTEEITIGF